MTGSGVAGVTVALGVGESPPTPAESSSPDRAGGATPSRNDLFTPRQTAQMNKQETTSSAVAARGRHDRVTAPTIRPQTGGGGISTGRAVKRAFRYSKHSEQPRRWARRVASGSLFVSTISASDVWLGQSTRSGFG